MTDARAGSDRLSSAPTEQRRQTGWVGLVAFAGMLLLMVGSFQIFEGIVALFRDEFYLVGSSGLMLPIDLTAWAWIHLLVGVIAFAAGFGMLYGQMWARVLGIVFAVISALSHLLFGAAYPIWSIIIVTVDVLIIYALTVHGREVKY
ncbi:DUF7144 family membrane protein [Cryptosporangium minutisporangium]|uniref:Membrane protein n=1 Tax=Cryptosporangium minutisporangium TaxID=113569 RepID=A0ABP6SZQ4_9ACTN